VSVAPLLLVDVAVGVAVVVVLVVVVAAAAVATAVVAAAEATAVAAAAAAVAEVAATAAKGLPWCRSHLLSAGPGQFRTSLLMRSDPCAISRRILSRPRLNWCSALSVPSVSPVSVAHTMLSWRERNTSRTTPRYLGQAAGSSDHCLALLVVASGARFFPKRRKQWHPQQPWAGEQPMEACTYAS
jgi:hypothetical protein